MKIVLIIWTATIFGSYEEQRTVAVFDDAKSCVESALEKLDIMEDLKLMCVPESYIGS